MKHLITLLMIAYGAISYSQFTVTLEANPDSLSEAEAFCIDHGMVYNDSLDMYELTIGTDTLFYEFMHESMSNSMFICLYVIDENQEQLIQEHHVPSHAEDPEDLGPEWRLTHTLYWTTTGISVKNQDVVNGVYYVAWDIYSNGVEEKHFPRKFAK